MSSSHLQCGLDLLIPFSQTEHGKLWGCHGRHWPTERPWLPFLSLLLFLTLPASLCSVHIVSTSLERLTCLEGMSPADRQRIWDLPRAPRVSFIVNFLRPARWVNLEADLPPRPALRHLGLDQHCDYCLMRHSEIETPAKLCLDSWCRETEIIHGGMGGQGDTFGTGNVFQKVPTPSSRSSILKSLLEHAQLYGQNTHSNQICWSNWINTMYSLGFTRFLSEFFS